MARTGAVPADFHALSTSDICRVLDYLAWAAADGTYCFANAIRGKPLPVLHHDTQEERDASFLRIYGSLVPMKRPLCDRPTTRPPAEQTSSVDNTSVRLYTDGSFTAASGDDGNERPAISGWGLCPVIPAHLALDAASSSEPSNEPYRTMRFHGPTVLDSQASRWHGARKHSNNVAELEGIIAACQYALRSLQGTSIQICFDSKYAAMIAMQRWRPRANIRLARTAAALVAQVRNHVQLTWAWVKGHANDIYNELADQYAARGARGELLLWDGASPLTPSQG